MDMTYEHLIKVLNSPMTGKEEGEKMMLIYMSQDDKVIPAMLKMLEIQRKDKKELIEDMNVNLTRNTFAIMHPEVTMGNEPEKQKEFYLNETKEFYKKYEGTIRTAGMKLWDDVK